MVSFGFKRDRTPRRGLLHSLRRDIAGNTLAIVGASIFPLIGMIGGAVDMSRLYLVKTRLQQACDAGSLAGRKVMGGGTWDANSNAANAAAEKFFNTNFQSGAYGTSNLTKSFSEDAGKVSGNASADVPMTLMRVFNMSTRTISVVCDAEMRLPNTDVMFVLDNTGSMADTLSGDTQSKISALRTAVKCFFEIVARLDTNAACDGTPPSGGVGDEVQVRFGFVPYATNVNVGRLLPSSWFADSWPYQSRQITTVYGLPTTYSDGSLGSYGATTTVTTRSGLANQTACQTLLATYTDNNAPSSAVYGAPYNETTTGWQATQPYQFNDYNYTWTGTPKVCTITLRSAPFTRTWTFQRMPTNSAGTVPFSAWWYRQVPTNITGLKNGSGWNSSVSLPIGNGYTSTNVAWNGCIEERHTVRQTSYSPIPADADDLDIDQVPTQSDPNSLWGPALYDAVFARRSTYSNSSAQSVNEITTFTNFTGNKANACPAEARRLQEWTDASSFDDYVDNLSPGGNTYHDIGLLWGGRLLSPTGLFRADNQFTPRGGEIERHLIFMTDGETCTDEANYSAYGLPWYDRRQTSTSVAPEGHCEAPGDTGGVLSEQVNARYAALCQAVRNKNITLWVIWFGANFPTAETRLTTCATPGRFFAARNSSQLQATFRSIANQISQLRLTR